MVIKEPQTSAFSVLLHLEHDIRQAKSLDELKFIVVNLSKRLLHYQQAVLLLVKNGVLSVKAVSGVPEFDRLSPYLVKLEQLVNAHWSSRLSNLQKLRCHKAELKLPSPGENEAETLDVSALAFGLPKDVKQSLTLLFCPLVANESSSLGCLCFIRATVWQDHERILAKRLCEAYAYSWRYLSQVHQHQNFALRPLMRVLALSRLKWLFILLACCLVTLLPVRLSVLAPVEITALNPATVNSPLSGVIAEFYVEPYSFVEQGRVLFRFDDEDVRNRYTLADKNLSITLAEYRKAEQQAISGWQERSNVAEFKARVALQTAELDYARSMLERLKVKASRAGVLVYADNDDWLGRPVSIGQSIMKIADPASTQLRIELPVAELIPLKKGNGVLIFLNINPLASIAGAVSDIAYKTSITEEGVLVYRVMAQFSAKESQHNGLRIGLRGTAKIYGDKVSLFYLVFRRPITFVRQLVGL